MISDLYEEPDEVLDALSLIRSRGNDVILFHVLDPAEIDFSFEDASSFEDLESGEQLPVVPDALRKQYRAMIQEHIAALTTKSSEQRVDYNLLNTSVPLDYALFNYMVEVAPDGRTLGPVGGRGRGRTQTSDDPRAPDILTAFREQLGLQLEAVQAPLDYVVVDRIERPSPN